MFGKVETKKHRSKFVASLITLAVITLLVFAGPAQAFSMNMTDFSNTNPNKGELVSATATLSVNSNDRMSLSNPVQLLIDGQVSCEFDINGNNLTACEGITIDLLSNSASQGNGYGYSYGYSYGYNYGYGYGYSNGQFTYNITLDTDEFIIGTHNIQLKMNAGANQVYSSSTKSLTINPEGASSVITDDVTAGEDKDFSGISLNLTNNSRVAVAKFTSTPAGIGANPSGVIGLGDYFQIESTTTPGSGTMIKISYTDAQITALGLDEASLKLYFYNETSSSWQQASNSGVNTTGNYVWAITDHFSTWTAFGTAPATTTTQSTTSDGSGGGYLPAKATNNTAGSEGTSGSADNNEGTTGNNSPITGAVTGTTAKAVWTGVIILILAIAGLYLFVRYKKRKSKK